VGNSECPDPTYAMQGWLPLNATAHPPIFCVCPHRFACAGCGRLCKNTGIKTGESRRETDASPPTRCVHGFYRGTQQAASAMCTPRGTASGGMWIQSDRCGSTPRPPFHPEVNGTFVFTISNGHAGTKFLGARATWSRTLPPGVSFPLEVRTEFEAFPQNLAVQQVGLHRNHCPLGRLYLKRVWWPQKSIDATMGPQSTVRTWFDSGHLASFVLRQLVEVLGPARIGLIRLRRNRIDLAFSKLVSVQSVGLTEADDAVEIGPCASACVWCFCPLDAATVCLPLGRAWSRMTPFQKFLWEVDELECVWRSFLQRGPPLRTIDVNWTQAIGTAELSRIAAFVGIPFASAVTSDAKGVRDAHARNAHVNRSHLERKNRTELLRQAAAYQTLLKPVRCDDYACVWW